MPWGYMGKVPNRGDFLTHNITPELQDLLFEWCQATMAVSREQLGDDWLDAYLTSPIWHFGASPGVFVEQGVIGTLIPSIDRVGRHFPFMVLSEFSGTAFEAWHQPEWSSSMEDSVLAVLDDDWNEQSWQRRLEAIDPPPSSPARMRWPGDEGNLMIPGDVDEGDWLRALIERRRGQAIWWTRGSSRVAPSTLITDGLPKVAQFAAMLAGDWQEWGWNQGVVAG